MVLRFTRSIVFVEVGVEDAFLFSQPIHGLLIAPSMDDFEHAVTVIATEGGFIDSGQF